MLSSIETENSSLWNGLKIRTTQKLAISAQVNDTSVHYTFAVGEGTQSFRSAAAEKVQEAFVHCFSLRKKRALAVEN